MNETKIMDQIETTTPTVIIAPKETLINQIDRESASEIMRVDTGATTNLEIIEIADITIGLEMIAMTTNTTNTVDL